MTESGGQNTQASTKRLTWKDSNSGEGVVDTFEAQGACRLNEDRGNRAPDATVREKEGTCEDTFSFRATCRGRPGYLLISASGLRFVKTYSVAFGTKPHHPRTLWSYPFASLVQMSKRHSSTSSWIGHFSPTLEGLEFEFLTTSITRVGRDGASNDINGNAMTMRTIPFQLRL